MSSAMLGAGDGGEHMEKKIYKAEKSLLPWPNTPSVTEDRWQEKQSLSPLYRPLCLKGPGRGYQVHSLKRY